MSGPGRAGEADRTLFVGNLESRVREEILYELFLQEDYIFKTSSKCLSLLLLELLLLVLEDPDLLIRQIMRRMDICHFEEKLQCSAEQQKNALEPTQAGPLTKVTICKDKEGKPKSFGFVCFKHKESVPYAIALLNGIRLYGRPIKVRYRFGSSHSSELNSPTHGFENYVDLYSPSYRYQEPYGNPPFPVTPFPMNNFLPQEHSVFQKMMNHFLEQQYTVHSPVGQQFPYYQMTLPLPSSLSIPPYQNEAANFKSGQSSFELVVPHSSDGKVYQVDESTSKRKREQQSCDSDTSTEDDRMRQRDCDQKYNKCKAKKKRH